MIHADYLALVNGCGYRHAKSGGKIEENPYLGGLSNDCIESWNSGFTSYHNSFSPPKQDPIHAHDNFVAED